MVACVDEQFNFSHRQSQRARSPTLGANRGEHFEPTNKEALKDTWTMFHREHGVSVDRMLCRPALRAEFIEAARLTAGEQDEEKLLWSVVQLRKGKKLPSVLR